MQFCAACGFHLDSEIFHHCPWCGFDLTMALNEAQRTVLSIGFCIQKNRRLIPPLDFMRNANFTYQIQPNFLAQSLNICAKHFFGIRLISPNRLIARHDVRAMCQPNMCQAYETNWTCPPAIISIEECQKQLLSFSYAILLQTLGSIEDSFDYDQMMQIEKKHNQMLLKCRNQIRLFHKHTLALGAGACRLCKTCTYPKSPCIHPNDSMASMEAYGLLVSEVCLQSNLPYYYKNNTITFMGCLLI